MLQPAYRQTANSHKLKAVISRLGGSVWGALADSGLGEETVINLWPESKETSANTAKDQHHFIEGRGIDTRGVVGLKEEKERLDTKKRKGPKIARKRKKLRQPVLLLHPALQKALRRGALV